MFNLDTYDSFFKLKMQTERYCQNKTKNLLFSSKQCDQYFI